MENDVERALVFFVFFWKRRHLVFFCRIKQVFFWGGSHHFKLWEDVYILNRSMWKRTNLEDAHENPLVSSQITCLKTRLRFVDKILFFQFNCSCLKKNSNTFWPTYRLYQLVLICVLILHIKINMFWIITVVFLCLTSLSIFGWQVDFCVFTIKNNIEEQKTKTWRKTPWSGSVGEVLLQLRMPGVFFPCLPGVKTPVVNLGQFWVVKKTVFGSIFFPVHLCWKRSCNRWKITVPYSAALGLCVFHFLHWRSLAANHPKGRWVETNQRGLWGCWMIFFWHWNSLLVENPNKNLDAQQTLLEKHHRCIYWYFLLVFCVSSRIFCWLFVGFATLRRFPPIH